MPNSYSYLPVLTEIAALLVYTIHAVLDPNQSTLISLPVQCGRSVLPNCCSEAYYVTLAALQEALARSDCSSTLESPIA